MSIPVQSLFDKIAPKRKRKPVATSRAYFCRCGRPVFFRNSVCLACNTPLGYEPHLQQVFPLTPDPDSEWWQLAVGVVNSAKSRRCAQSGIARRLQLAGLGKRNRAQSAPGVHRLPA